MTFLYPTYLWGFFLILIPIIIHLFQLRKYRTVYFSSLKFLKQLEIEKKKKSRIRELLLLLTRILLICVLVLAFASPVLPGKTDKASMQTVGIYIDNSQSMGNEADGQSLFDHAKSSALATIRDYPPDTKFYLLHNDGLFKSRFPVESKEAISNIELLDLSSRSTDMGEVLKRFSKILEDDSSPDDSKFYIFSDLQKSFVKPESVPDSLDFETRIVELPQGNFNNLFIDSCWFISPIQNVEKRHTIHARINNSSDQELPRFPVSLLIRDSLVAQETVSLSPYSTSEIQFSYNMPQGGWQDGVIEIRDYPVSFDNEFHFVYKVSDNIPVLQIFAATGNSHLRALFESDPYFDYHETEAAALPYQDLKRFRFIILNSLAELSRNLTDLLSDYVSQGGSLMVLPPESGNMTNINIFLQKLEAPVISNLLVQASDARIPDHMKSFYEQISMNPTQQVEWPNFIKYYRLIDNYSHSSSLLNNETGRPLLFRAAFGSGYLTVSAAPLISEFTNFQVHPLFIPFMYYLANAGMEDQELYTRIGGVSPLSVDIENDATRGPVHVKSADESVDIIPGQFRDPQSGRLLLHLPDYYGPAGILDVTRSEGSEALIAMNYSREESQVESIGIEEINKMIDDFGWSNIKFIKSTDQIGSGDETSNNDRALSLIRILLLLALIFLALESVIHRVKT